MSIMRVDASLGATFKASYYLRSVIETRYFATRSAAEAWLDNSLREHEQAGRLWRMPADTESGWRVRNLFGEEGLILGIVIACSSQVRNPSVDVVLFVPGAARQRRGFSFGHTRSFAEAFTSACLLFVRYHGLGMAHLRQMLSTADAYLDYYQLDHYRDTDALAIALDTTRAIFAQEQSVAHGVGAH